MEDKLNQAHLEVQQLKASVKNYEGMIDNYKSQVGLSGAPALPGQHPPEAGGFTTRPLLGRGWKALPKTARCCLVPR